jgi:vacuolar iron transporter family protein
MTAHAVSPGAPEVSHDHPDVTGGWLRPAVFGAMDGLVSNLALVAGVAGGTRDQAGSSAIVLAGLAGLAAGAFSMAVGEYNSVASQSEAAQREIDKERREIIANPVAETSELAQVYVDKGLSSELAAEVARQIHTDVENAVSVHSRSRRSCRSPWERCCRCFPTCSEPAAWFRGSWSPWWRCSSAVPW